jgi:hypothetical protein
MVSATLSKTVFRARSARKNAPAAARNSVTSPVVCHPMPPCSHAARSRRIRIITRLMIHHKKEIHLYAAASLINATQKFSQWTFNAHAHEYFSFRGDYSFI